MLERTFWMKCSEHFKCQVTTYKNVFKMTFKPGDFVLISTSCVAFNDPRIGYSDDDDIFLWAGSYYLVLECYNSKWVGLLTQSGKKYVFYDNLSMVIYVAKKERNAH